MDWVRHIKVGDRVFMAHQWAARENAMTTVTKVGRKWVSFSNGLRYSFETERVEGSSYKLWRSIEDYKKDLDIRSRWRNIGDKLANETKRIELNVTEEKLEQIEQILGLSPKKS